MVIFPRARESFTGNVVSVNKEELAKVSSNNLISALQVFDPSFRLRENVDMGSNRIVYLIFVFVVIPVSGWKACLRPRLGMTRIYPLLSWMVMRSM